MFSTNMDLIKPHKITACVRPASVERFDRANRLNLNCIRSLAQYKATTGGYKLRASSHRENIHRIIACIKAFNDIEIEYSDELLADEQGLVRKSKKPLWVMSASGNGEFVLTRAA